MGTARLRMLFFMFVFNFPETESCLLVAAAGTSPEFLITFGLRYYQVSLLFCHKTEMSLILEYDCDQREPAALQSKTDELSKDEDHEEEGDDGQPLLKHVQLSLGFKRHSGYQGSQKMQPPQPTLNTDCHCFRMS